MERILLVTLSSKTHRTREENLGIQYLSSALRQHKYEVVLLNSWLNNLSIYDIFVFITNNSFLFVGISTSYMTNKEDCKELIKLIKNHNKNINIVCGGFGPTFLASEYIGFGADIVCIGEGEKTIIDIANYYEHKKESLNDIDGIAFATGRECIYTKKRELINDLDTISFPSRDTLDQIMKMKSAVSVCTSRGCTGKCDFCSVFAFFSKSNGKKWRGRSVNNITNELKLLNDKGVCYVKVVDDSFIDGNRNEAWCEEFKNEILRKKIKLNMKGQIRVDKITEKTMECLREAGFYSFSCGIENGSETALHRMNKFSNMQHIEYALSVMKKYEFIFQMGFILFDNKTTYHELKENYSFLKRHLWTVTKGIFTEMYPLEGTLYTKKLMDTGAYDNSFKLEGNNWKYSCKYEDVRVNLVYSALKKWHTTHTYIYDMTIDPLVGPKAIDFSYMLDLYKEVMIIKQIDIDFFEKVLNLVDTGANDSEIENFTLQEIANQKIIFDNVFNNVSQIYKKNSIIYDAVTNPFL